MIYFFLENYLMNYIISFNSDDNNQKNQFLIAKNKTQEYNVVVNVKRFHKKRKGEKNENQ